MVMGRALRKEMERRLRLERSAQRRGFWRTRVDPLLSLHDKEVEILHRAGWREDRRVWRAGMGWDIPPCK